MWGNIPLEMIMPALPNKQQTQALYANVSRLFTATRWVNEAVYGILDGKFGVFSNKIHQQQKEYIDDWAPTLVAVHNFMNPLGSHHKDAGHDNERMNYHRYKVRTEFFSNQIQRTVNHLIYEASGRWIPVDGDEVTRLIRPFRIFAQLLDDEIKLFSGGNYGYKQRNKYIEHNLGGETISLYIHSSQNPGYDAWRECIRINERDEPDEYKRAENRKRIDRNAWIETFEHCKRNRDRYIILKLDKITSRHTRKNKPKKKYSVYFALDERGFREDGKILDPYVAVEAEDPKECWNDILSQVPSDEDNEDDVKMSDSSNSRYIMSIIHFIPFHDEMHMMITNK